MSCRFVVKNSASLLQSFRVKDHIQDTPSRNITTGYPSTNAVITQQQHTPNRQLLESSFGARDRCGDGLVSSELVALEMNINALNTRPQDGLDFEENLVAIAPSSPIDADTMSAVNSASLWSIKSCRFSSDPSLGTADTLIHGKITPLTPVNPFPISEDGNSTLANTLPYHIATCPAIANASSLTIDPLITNDTTRFSITSNLHPPTIKSSTILSARLVPPLKPQKLRLPPLLSLSAITSLSHFSGVSSVFYRPQLLNPRILDVLVFLEHLSFPHLQECSLHPREPPSCSCKHDLHSCERSPSLHHHFLCDCEHLPAHSRSRHHKQSPSSRDLLYFPTHTQHLRRCPSAFISPPHHHPTLRKPATNHCCHEPPHNRKHTLDPYGSAHNDLQHHSHRYHHLSLFMLVFTPHIHTFYPSTLL